MVKLKKSREKPKRRWLDEATEKMRLKLDGILNLVTSRSEWRKAVHELTIKS